MSYVIMVLCIFSEYTINISVDILTLRHSMRETPPSSMRLVSRAKC